MTKSEVKQLLDAISEIWPKAPNGRVTTSLWFDVLEPYSFEDCYKALVEHQKGENGMYAPRPNDIYKGCEKIAKEREDVVNVVYECRERAINSFPSRGEEEMKEAKILFDKICYESEDAAKTAMELETYLDKRRWKAEREKRVRQLKPLTEIIKGACL